MMGGSKTANTTDIGSTVSTGGAVTGIPPATAKTWPGGIVNASTVLHNMGLLNFVPPLITQSIAISVNKAAWTQQLCAHLNETYSPLFINTVIAFIITTAGYWAFGLLFMIIDLTERPRWLLKYKVQPCKRIPLSQYPKLCRITLRNQLFVNLPLGYVMAKWVMPWRGMRSDLPLPGPMETVANWIVCVLCAEIGFYHVHRLLHLPRFYAKFHKKHHEFTAPVALATTYCTMTEHAFSNVIPVLIGHTIFGSHFTIYVMTFLDLSGVSMLSHCGYNIPGLSGSLRHDYHHFAFTENFGPTGLLDAWYGTAKNYERLLAEAIAGSGGDVNKACTEISSNLAQLQWDEEVRESAKVNGHVTSSEMVGATPTPVRDGEQSEPTRTS